ncbi:hypothetical protein [Gordonia sp. (in: high G+C Gram-positive bacteria)]|uniref:hypothetical protein n=1 Tax=Gordonia sp. (in: high G+C Gram-positive bacteria) TaxID=84139 RepID=UPI0026263679|nr:hypothetical protein [Gordonia sp. (in: high G+C Gram-positive bacteria)]
MGREAIGTATWRGATAEVKVLLESQDLILRGGIRARLPRAGISDVVADGERVRVRVNGEPLVLILGEPEAGRWAEALLKAPPTLAEKLGISAATPARVRGVADHARRAAHPGAPPPPRRPLRPPPPPPVASPRPRRRAPRAGGGGPPHDALRAALAGAETEMVGEASALVAVLHDATDLDAAVAVAETVPDLPVWFVYPKGTSGPIGGETVRARLRERGYIDSKTSAVSDRFTATRYRRRTIG